MSNNNDLDFFPWDSIPDSNVFPTGTFLFEIASIEDGESSTGKRMLKARFDCLEPVNMKGQAYFDQYVLGTDEEPQKVVPSAMGSQMFKKVLKGAQIPKSSSISNAIEQSLGNHVILKLLQYKDESPGPYRGTLKNKMQAAYKIGEAEIKIEASGGGASAPGLSSSAPPVGRPPKVTNLTCATCGKSIPKGEYSAHVENCMGADS